MDSSKSPPPAALFGSAFVIGGVTAETKFLDFEKPMLQIACYKLGEVLAQANVQLILCSPFPDSADYYTAKGFATAGVGGVIHFHSPIHPDVEEKRLQLTEIFGSKCPKIVPWHYPGPESDDEWNQAWLLCQLQALEKADVVIAIGGKVSKTANTLLHLAEGRKIPILPFTFLGGAAKRAFNRIDWSKLYPDIDTSILGQEDGVSKVIEITNRLIINSVTSDYVNISEPRTFFISHSKEDLTVAKELSKYLKQANFDVIRGEEAIRTGKMVQASIEETILRSDICIILWSRHYALSPWCYDELTLSINRRDANQLGIWLFNLDDSPIVPKEARKLKVITAKTITEVIGVAKDLLNQR
jgi:hypothetical protein